MAKTVYDFMSFDLLSFTLKAYSNFDKSHDYYHAVKVLNNVGTIIQKAKFELSDDELKTLAFTALLHDAIDYKYKDKWVITEQELEEYLQKNLDPKWVKCAIFTITNSSWSKQNYLNKNDENYNPLIFHLVRDADWMEAINVDRCIDYSVAIGREVPKGVIDYIEETLIHIKDKLYYPESKEMAQNEHLRLVAYYEKNKIQK